MWSKMTSYCFKKVLDFFRRLPKASAHFEITALLIYLVLLCFSLLY